MTNNTQADIAAGARSPEEVERIVVIERLHRYNHGLPCGAVALRRHLRENASSQPLPSVRRITQILTQYGLTHGRTGWYEGEEPDWLPASALVPKAQRRHLSSIDRCNR